MADATRFQVMSKQIDEQKQATDAIATQTEKLTQSQAQIDKLVQSQQKMEAMMAALMSQRSSQLSRPPDPPYSASGDLTSYSQAPQPPDPPDCKTHTEFPKFDGTLLREWFRRCDEYFYLHNTPPEMRVRVASPHMIGKALQWHTNYIRNNFGMFPPWLDYTIAITAQFGDNDALPMHRAPFSPYRNQNNQPHYNTPNTISLLPPPETNMEKSPMKFFCEEIQESGMRGLCMSSDGSYANGHHLESKKPQIFVMECEDATISGDETNAETNSLLEKETIPSSALCGQISATQSQDFNVIQQEKLIHDTETTMEIGPVREPGSLRPTDSIFKVDFVPSQFQVPIPSLEPSRRRQKESLAVINDLSYGLGCVISKTNGCICDSDLGQANYHDVKEFKGLNLKKLLAIMEGLAQKISCGLLCGDSKFHLKHKWRSRLEFCEENDILFTSSVKLLFPKNHKLLHYEAEFCAQYNDLKQLSKDFQSFTGDEIQGTEKLWVLNEPMIGTSFSPMKNTESLKEHEQLEDAAKGIRSYESKIGHVEKSLTEFSVYGLFHLQRPPELGQTKQYGQDSRALPSFLLIIFEDKDVLKRGVLLQDNPV